MLIQGGINGYSTGRPTEILYILIFGDHVQVFVFFFEYFDCPAIFHNISSNYIKTFRVDWGKTNQRNKPHNLRIRFRIIMPIPANARRVSPTPCEPGHVSPPCCPPGQKPGM